MKLVSAIVKTPTLVIVLMIGLCMGLSAYGFMSWGTPKVRSFLDHAVAHYDMYFPEVTIEKGQTSIKKPQPYYVDFGQGKNAPIIIDTRPGFEEAALGYLKSAHEGFVLTRNSLVIKNKGEVRIVPLKNIPDFVLNSDSLRLLIDEFYPRIASVAAVVVAIYFLFSKTLQVLVLALVPFGWARVGGARLSYGQCLKIAAFCMVPSVILMAFQDLFGIPVGGKLVYFGLYLLFLIVVSVLATRSMRPEPEPEESINP